MEDNKMLVVGYAMHGMSSAFAEMSKKDMIVIDSSNIDTIKEQLQAHKEERGITINKHMVPKLKEDVYVIDSMKDHIPHRKKHKPNTGLQLGSYKYKSKRK